MNKGRRQELKQLKYKKRIKKIFHKTISTDQALKKPRGKNYNFTGLKNHSTPCSCSVCSPQKYNRAKEKSGLKFAVEENLP